MFLYSFKSSESGAVNADIFGTSTDIRSSLTILAMALLERSEMVHKGF